MVSTKDILADARAKAARRAQKNKTAPVRPDPDSASLDKTLLALDVAETLLQDKIDPANILADPQRQAAWVERQHAIYAAQGITVSKADVLDGLQAAKDRRFVPAPQKSGLSPLLARAYVARKSWAPLVYMLLTITIAAWAINHYAFVRPAQIEAQRLEAQLNNILPQKLDMAREAALNVAYNQGQRERVGTLYQDGLKALDEREISPAQTVISALQALVPEFERENKLASLFRDTYPAELKRARDTANRLGASSSIKAEINRLYLAGEDSLTLKNEAAYQRALEALKTLTVTLSLDYKVRIVSRPGQYSGVFRINDDGPQPVRNYYLIVEGIDSRGQPIRLKISSEEDQITREVSMWGLRVPENVFNRVAADKRDDQIIQNAIVGHKKRGYLTPHYSITTSGAHIVEW